MKRRTLIGSLLCTLGLAALGCAHKQPAPPPRPTPPTEPLSWVPDESTVVGRVQLDALRDTPLWKPMWSEVTRQQRIASWVDLSKIESITFGGTGKTRKDTAYIAALVGQFDAAELRTLAARDAIAPETRGLLTVYRRPDGDWAQISDRLIVTCTPNRIDALVARASAGPDAKIKESALYRSLADRIALTGAHLAVIAEDREGDQRAEIDRRAASFGLGSIARDASRVGVALTAGGSYRVVGAAEAESATRAEALASSVRNTLDGFASNILVRALGVAGLIGALSTTQDGNYVFVRGALPADELNAVLGRLTGAMELAGALDRRRGAGAEDGPDALDSDEGP
ncbi:MAG: hypothetical protein ABW252_16240 [Polyangiales bacterium]